MEPFTHLKVVVLMGGPSEEHDISLKSGSGVTEALRRRRWTVEPLVIPKTLDVEEACRFVRRSLAHARADVAFLALHGRFGEDGTIQQVCEELRMAYTGSDATASRLGMDKIVSRARFEAAHLTVPHWQAVDRRIATARPPSSWLSRSLAYPLVVKPADQGSSIGVSIVRSAEALPEALREAGRYGPQVLIEEFVEGREVTVGVLGDEALPVVEICSSHPFFDFTAKYTTGATQYRVPAPLDPAVTAMVQAAGLTAHRALGCRHLSRTDMILTTQDVPVVLEVNTIPGFTPTSLLPKAAACRDLSYDALCEQLVLMAWEGASHPATVLANPHA